MHPRHGQIIRPLLDCRRVELRNYLEERGLAFVHDETNDDVAIPRNRVRAELLPLLERRFNPSIVNVLADAARIAGDEWQWLQTEAARVTADLVEERAGQVWTVDVDRLAAHPVAIQRAVIRALLLRAASGRPVSFRHVEEAIQVARVGGPPVDGPAVRLERRSGLLVLTRRAAREPALMRQNLFRYPLSIPGEVSLVEAGCVLSAEAASSATPGAIPSSSATACLQLDRCRGPLTVRNRRPGDRLRPLGLNGRKKLQDYFVDKKVPRSQRDRVPLVVDDTDRIMWVAGHGIDHEFRVTDPAQAVLILRLRQV
jgi:tRNA(Ile)-lysidine synthase